MYKTRNETQLSANKNVKYNFALVLNIKKTKQLKIRYSQILVSIGVKILNAFPLFMLKDQNTHLPR